MSAKRVIALFALVGACSQPYRVGEYVLVEWEPGHLYPAYIVETKSRTTFRVHYEGYDSRWDEDVGIQRIKGRIEGPVAPPPPPEKVARAAGIAVPKGSSSAGPVSTYKVGDRVKVTWRGSVYPATIVGIVAQDRFLIHYDGLESAWDETIHSDRIVGAR